MDTKATKRVAPPHGTATDETLDTVLAALSRLERKVDDLRELVEQRAEPVLDIDWERMSKALPSTGERLPVVLATDDRHAALIGELEARDGKAGGAHVLSDDQLDELVELADRLVAGRATSVAERRLKALALRELCEEWSDDLVHRLAASLAADLIADTDR